MEDWIRDHQVVTGRIQRSLDGVAESLDQQRKAVNENATMVLRAISDWRKEHNAGERAEDKALKTLEARVAELERARADAFEEEGLP